MSSLVLCSQWKRPCNYNSSLSGSGSTMKSGSKCQVCLPVAVGSPGSLF